MELGTNDHGAIAELLSSTTAGLPAPIEETIRTHATSHYSSYIPDTESLRVRSIARQQGESPISHLDGINLPEEGDWGYSKGWIPDDILIATWNLSNGESDEPTDEATPVQDSADTPPVFSLKDRPRTMEPSKKMQVYYPIEVKSVTSYRRIRLTENQSDTFVLLANDVDYVHPLLVMLDLNDLPESVGIEVDLIEDSRWGEGTRTKSV